MLMFLFHFHDLHEVGMKQKKTSVFFQQLCTPIHTHMQRSSFTYFFSRWILIVHVCHNFKFSIQLFILVTPIKNYSRKILFWYFFQIVHFK